MKNVTKTVDLSEYSDEQIKIMFQSMEFFDMIKTLVAALKSGRIGQPNYGMDFNSNTPAKQILEALKIGCEKYKIDPKLLDL